MNEEKCFIANTLNLTGTDYKCFKDSRIEFESSTVIVTADFAVESFEVLRFFGCEDGYMVFIAVNGVGKRRIRIRADSLPEVLLKELQNGMVSYLLKIGKVFLFVKEDTVTQLARRLQLPGKLLKSMTDEASLAIWNKIAGSKRKYAFVLRTQQGFHVLVNLFLDDVKMRSALIYTDKLSNNSNLEVSFWRITQESTKIIFQAKSCLQGVYPCICMTFSDSGRTTREIALGIKTKDSEWPVFLISYKENISIEKCIKKLENISELLSKTEANTTTCNTNLALCNEKVEHALGSKRMQQMESEKNKEIPIPDFIRMTIAIPVNCCPMYKAADRELSYALGQAIYEVISNI